MRKRKPRVCGQKAAHLPKGLREKNNMTSRFNFKQASEFAHDDRNPIAELLTEATQHARTKNWGSVCWRLADAVLLLRSKLERMDYSGEGWDVQTQRGGMLQATPCACSTGFKPTPPGAAQITVGTAPLLSLFN